LQQDNGSLKLLTENYFIFWTPLIQNYSLGQRRELGKLILTTFPLILLGLDKNPGPPEIHPQLPEAERDGRPFRNRTRDTIVNNLH
jgi:hypothetical protein